MKTVNATPDFFKPDFGLENAGLKTEKTIYWNYSTPALYQEALERKELTRKTLMDTRFHIFLRYLGFINRNLTKLE